tara:strand:+ start:357 stop:659 length:303 start_codon:yes stop_codon:yes gene_type:complete
MQETLEKATESKVQKKKAVINKKLQQELICEEVMERLRPVSNFHKISAHNVFDDNWRVNVWVEDWKEEATSCGYKIKYSYFCEVKDNCIFESSPELPPKY